MTSITAVQISDGVIEFRAGEALGRVLVADLGARQRALQFAAEAGGIDRDLGDAGPVGAEHHPPLQHRRRVVEVDDGGARARSPSYVRSISSGRHWVRTWMVTSSGMRWSSMSSRRKLKSGWLALGKPTSISLKPIATTASNMRRLRAGSIGSMRAWLPSRRSTEHHSGALVIWRFGHSRSGKCRGSGKNGLYFSNGIFFGMGDPFRGNTKPPGPEVQQVKASVGEGSALLMRRVEAR